MEKVTKKKIWLCQWVIYHHLNPTELKCEHHIPKLIQAFKWIRWKCGGISSQWKINYTLPAKNRCVHAHMYIIAWLAISSYNSLSSSHNSFQGLFMPSFNHADTEMLKTSLYIEQKLWTQVKSSKYNGSFPIKMFP